jgi:acetolactate synthase-1/2/3 large subunit
MKPGQRYIRCAGSLGWAFPATIGVKAALGDEHVIGFCGDAGFYYHMAELETAARCGLNLVMIVNNNHSGGVSETARFHADVNFAKVAESMGCAGLRVERGADIQPALDKALAAGKPAIVEILSDPAIRAKRGWTPPAVSGE